MTNSFFTEQAIECAETWEVDLLRDRREELANYVDGTPPEVDTTRCAECGAAVTERHHDVVPGSPRPLRGQCVLPQAPSEIAAPSGVASEAESDHPRVFYWPRTGLVVIRSSSEQSAFE